LDERREIALGPWAITEERVQQYLKAVGDTSSLYFETGLAPPLVLAAYAVGALLEKLSLAPGAIHTIQEVETLAPISFGEVISGTASLGRPKRIGERQFISASFALVDGRGGKVLTATSTVAVPAPFQPHQEESRLAPGR
jgi:acyl dehydratase